MKHQIQVEEEIHSSGEEKKTIDEILLEEREHCTSSLYEMGFLFKDFMKMGELQVKVYSERQRLIERIHYYLSTLSKYTTKYKKKKAELFIKYTQGSDLLLKTASEKSIMMDSDLSQMKEKIDNLEFQIEFLKETVKTVDSIIYGIKNRIDLEKMIQGY